MAALRLVPLLVGALLVGLFAACLLGPTPLAPHRIALALMGLATPEENLVVQSIRLPRALSGMLTGAALGISGAALQGLLRNPLAGPGVLGVSVAASFGATLTIAFGLSSVVPLAVPAGALAGALASTAIIAYFAFRTRSVVTLILIGVALSSFLGALMSLIISLSPSPLTTTELLNWSFGSVANRSWRDIGIALGPVATGSWLMIKSRRELTALTLGEESATTMGIDIRRVRIYIVVGAGLATGGAVSLAGAIGFVGIIAPHIVRPWVQNDPARTLWPSALVGAALVSYADILIRILPTYTELRLGIAIAIIGAPFFAFIVNQQRRISS